MDTITKEQADAQVKLCMDEPGKHLSEPLTQLSAQYIYNNQPLHKCYWNNRFAVAVMCDMDEAAQQLAAWYAMINGTTGYWEWISHSEYDMAKVLHYLNIDTGIIVPDKNYHTLDNGIIRQLCKKFRLPTIEMAAGLRIADRKTVNDFFEDVLARYKLNQNRDPEKLLAN